MYKLIVKKPLELADGRNFQPGHDADGLTKLEVKDLLEKYPDHFDPANEQTASLAEELITDGTFSSSGALETKKTKKGG